MKFKVGDRVKVYGNTGVDDTRCGSYFATGVKATVTNVVDNQELQVETDRNYWGRRYYQFHPKQCRKLKRNKK